MDSISSNRPSANKPPAVARLFANGQSQAVRLPKEFRFAGDRVYITRVGGAVVLLPYHAPWSTLFESLEQFSEDFPHGA